MKIAKISRNMIRRIIIAVFCAFIGINVSFVMFHGYDPNRNSIVALSSVCMDVICMIILFILICSFSFGNFELNRTTKRYEVLVLATIWATFLDFLNWAFDGSLELHHLTYWFTVGSLCMGSILACIFSLYLSSYMEETHNLVVMRVRAQACACLNLFSFVLTFVLAMTGTAFQFVDGHYVTGALYNMVTVIPVLTLLYLTGFVICHVKEVGLHDVLAVAGYIIFMIVGALIEAGNNIGTTYVAVAIANFFIFVMLQNEIIAREKRNVHEWMVKSNTDELTGFYNRHAYEADLAALEAKTLDNNFIYVSADVNSLKTVNDSFGHNAGDELLLGASECLKKCFGAYGKLYRIGGDEFIALIYAEDNQLDAMKENIAKLTETWSGKMVQDLTISCGYVTKREKPKMSVRQMAILADQRMYESKSEYYRRGDKDRRKA